MSRIGRNVPCDCRSGKKYKKCCLRYEEDRTHVGRLIWRIREALVPWSLDEVLLGMRRYDFRSFEEEPFLHATVCEFAVRFCQPGDTEETPHLSDEALRRITESVSCYAYSDPIGYDEEEQSKRLESEDVVVPLRILAKKFEMEFTPNQCFAQALHLFSIIPDFIKREKPENYPFDIVAAFRKEFTISPEVYIKACLISWDRARAEPTLNLSKLIPWVQHIATIGENECKDFLSNHLSADKIKFQQTLGNLQDPSFQAVMSKISPLSVFPFVRPSREETPEVNDRIIAPIPNLLAYKASQGVYNQLVAKYGTEFTNGFGYIFEEYVGRLLRSSFGSERVISESEITAESKKPDFIVIEDDIAVLVECKAFRYTKPLVTESTDESLRDSLKKVGKGLTQIQEFLEGNPCYLPRGKKIKEIVPVIITYGRTYMLTSPALKAPREKMLSDRGIQLKEWHLLDVRQLELLEPHFKSGESFSGVLRDIADSTFSEIFEKVASRTGKKFRDSFLYPCVQNLLAPVKEKSG